MRHGTRPSAALALLAASTLLWLGCGGGGGDITEPELGTLEIVTATTGPEPDADGYAVSLDDAAAEPVGANGVLRRTEIAAGPHTVELSGLAANCSVSGAARRGVTVAAGAVTTASFAISCAPTTGTVTVTVASTGPADPDGYLVLLDGAERGPIAVNGSLTLPAVTPGARAVGLAGLAAECRVEAENPRSVAVTAGATAAVSFEVACEPPPPILGALEIAVTTTGSPADPDGYTVSLDGGPTRPIGTSGTLVIEELTPGAHTVAFAGLAANCAVEGNNPRAVTIAAGATAELAVTVACGAVTGELAIAVAGLPAGTDAAVTVSGPGGFSRRVTETRTLRDLAPGAYAVAAAEVVAGATRYTPTPASQSATVAAGAAASVTVTYAPVAPASLNLRIDSWHLTQGVQTPGNDIPMVANRDGYLRVFVVANEANQAAPSVRVRVFRDGTLAEVFEIPAPSASTPSGKDEDRLESSWNLKLPRTLFGPGFSLVAEVDPGNAIPEADEGDNTFPRSGTPATPAVHPVPVLGVRFVPVRQLANGLEGDVNADNKGPYLELTRNLFPLAGTDGDVHAVYTSDTADPLTPDDENGAWLAILSEVDALRVAEGTGRTYYGVVRIGYFAGIAGLGFLGVPTAIGYDNPFDRSRIMAHELGHTWNRLHAPCGAAPNSDPRYPYPGGQIGVYGIDRGAEVLKLPSQPDIMGYCGDPWISDYTYRAVKDYRSLAGARAAPGSAAVQRCLLVWGRIEDGRTVLEPAFELLTRPSLPAAPGAYGLEARAEDGTSLFSISFDPVTVADDPRGRKHFAFAVPLGEAAAARMTSLRLLGPAGEAAAVRLAPPAAAARAPDSLVVRRVAGGAAVRWDAAAHPMAMVRDPDTGEVLSFARGGEVEVATAKRSLEVVLSDRVGSRRLLVPVQP